MQAQVVGVATATGRWRGLFRTGAAGAFVAAVAVVAGVASYLAWPPPAEGGVADWFTIFQNNWLLGMLDLDAILLISYVALIPVVVALYVALHEGNDSLMALGAVFGLIAIATYFASSRVFEMLVLSSQYAAVSTDADKASLVAAGQSMLTTYLGAFAPPVVLAGVNYQGTAFNLSFVLWTVAGVLMSIAMLGHPQFGKVTGSLGIAGNIAACGLFVPIVGVWLALLALPVLLVWYVLVGIKLLRLAAP